MQSLICNVPPDTELLKCFDEIELPAIPGRKHGACAGGNSQILGSHANFGPSPYPALDEFVVSVCNQVMLVKRNMSAALTLTTAQSLSALNALQHFMCQYSSFCVLACSQTCTTRNCIHASGSAAFDKGLNVTNNRQDKKRSAPIGVFGRRQIDHNVPSLNVQYRQACI